MQCVHLIRTRNIQDMLLVGPCKEKRCSMTALSPLWMRAPRKVCADAVEASCRHLALLYFLYSSREVRILGVDWVLGIYRLSLEVGVLAALLKRITKADISVTVPSIQRLERANEDQVVQGTMRCCCARRTEAMPEGKRSRVHVVWWFCSHCRPRIGSPDRILLLPRTTRTNWWQTESLASICQPRVLFPSPLARASACSTVRYHWDPCYYAPC